MTFKRKPIVLAVASIKGGAGKTTCAINLAAAARERNLNALLIDNDAQGSATLALGLDPRDLEATEKTIDYAYSLKTTLSELIKRTVSGIEIVPAGINLAKMERILVGEASPNTRLKRLIGGLDSGYDFIVIDCSSCISVLTFNALCAADFVVIPVKTDYLNYQGLAVIKEVIDVTAYELNPNLEVLGILPMMQRKRLKCDAKALDLITEWARISSIRTFDSIPLATHIDRSYWENRPAISFGKKSGRAQIFSVLNEAVARRKE